jgi:Tfp pilus assembly protein PilP
MVKTKAPAKKAAMASTKTAAKAGKKPEAHVAETKPTLKPAGPSTAEKKPAPRLIGSAGRRDPFVSPIRNSDSVTPTQSCTSGKRCLAIPELVLQGTVRDITGKMMAVVSTSNRRTYTLRENDQVFNGSVEKITSDSIIFREYVKDALGRESAKEVVKKMGPTS